MTVFVSVKVYFDIVNTYLDYYLDCLFLENENLFFFFEYGIYYYRDCIRRGIRTGKIKVPLIKMPVFLRVKIYF